MKAIIACLLLFASAISASESTYDASTGTITIPVIRVGTTTYTNLVANINVTQLISVDSATLQGTEANNFLWQLNKCTTQGAHITCDLKVTSLGADRKLYLCAGCTDSGYLKISLTDNSGGTYTPKLIKVGNIGTEENPTGYRQDFSNGASSYVDTDYSTIYVAKVPLIQDVPTNVTIRFASLPASLTSVGALTIGSVNFRNVVPEVLALKSDQIDSIEDKNILYKFNSCSKQNTQLTCRLTLTSLFADKSISIRNSSSSYIYSNFVSIADSLGNVYAPTFIQIGNVSTAENQNGTQSFSNGASSYYYPGSTTISVSNVPLSLDTPTEVVLKVNNFAATATGVSFLQLGNAIFRNISF